MILPALPISSTGPSSEGLFFCMGWRGAVFGLVRVDCVGGWLFSRARGESRCTGSCGARGGCGAFWRAACGGIVRASRRGSRASSGSVACEPKGTSHGRVPWASAVGEGAKRGNGVAFLIRRHTQARTARFATRWGKYPFAPRIVAYEPKNRLAPTHPEEKPLVGGAG